MLTSISWSETVSAEMIVQILNIIRTEMPEVNPFVQILSQEVYDPIMAGELPTLSLPELTAQYPSFSRCVATHLAQRPAVGGITATDHSLRESSVLSSISHHSRSMSEGQEEWPYDPSTSQFKYHISRKQSPFLRSLIDEERNDTAGTTNGGNIPASTTATAGRI